MGQPLLDFEVHQALQQISLASNPLVAMEFFRENQVLLKDWRFIFATYEAGGPFKIRREKIGSNGILSSLFRGQSLWVIDTRAIIMPKAPYLVGIGIFLDSNAASYIRSLAYSRSPTPELLAATHMIEQARVDYGNLNPLLYLCEAQQHFATKPETLELAKETVAAIAALEQIPGPLDATWGQRYRAEYREAAEAHAHGVMREFQAQLAEGLGDEIGNQRNAAEAMLLRTKIIEASSRKSPQHKLQELVRFMSEELSILMVRELVVCADVLFREGRCSITHKLNSLGQQKDPLGSITNCASDLFTIRAVEFTSGINAHLPIDFYIGSIFSFDRDVVDVLALTELKGVAIHKATLKAFPFFNFDLAAWLNERLGERRFSEVQELFDGSAFKSRAERRSTERVRDLVTRDRERLLALLGR